MSHHCGRYERFTNRRDFLKKAGAGFGLLALADLLQGEGLLAADNGPAQALDPMSPRPPHYPAKAKSIVWLDRKSTRLNSSHGYISYAVFCLKKKKKTKCVSDIS